MKGFKEVNKSIIHYYNEHGLHKNSFYISNIHRIHFIPNRSFINILHGYKLVRLPYLLLSTIIGVTCWAQDTIKPNKKPNKTCNLLELKI